MIGIYKIISPSGKIYIGQSRNIDKRFQQYKKLKCAKQPRLYNSFIKYGIDTHIFEIVEKCEFDQLNNRERHYQDLYNVTSENGLNCVLTETNILPRIVSEETKRKVGNRILSPETRLKMSLSRKGTKWSEETKQKVKNKVIPEDVKIKMSLAKKDKYDGENHPFYGKTHSDETKEKMKLAKTKKVINTITNEIFNSSDECVLVNNLSITSRYLKLMLSGKRNNNTDFKYLS